jgi:very-short-patch-repair endonuclease
LVKRRYEVHTQVGVSGYKIDLAIYDKKKSKYVLGIECGGATYHSSKSARERDIHRQQYLESRGWIICRIWSRHWWRNTKSEIDKVDNLIKGVYN